MSQIENLAKKIHHRNWQEIRRRWFMYFPTIDPPGSPPTGELYDNVYLVEGLRSAKQANDKIYFNEFGGVREDIFREGIFLLHKANNITCASQNHLDNGIVSWSLSAVYQANYFLIKAILCFLGLSITQIDMEHLLVDCFPEDESLTSKEKKAGVKPKPRLMCIALGKLNHKAHWLIFQRVLRTTKVDFWENDIVRYLKSTSIDDFTLHRNSLHYKSAFWIEEKDLFERYYPEGFAVFEPKTYNVDTKNIDFLYFINYSLMVLVFGLLEDISREAPIVASEFQLMKKRFGNESLVRITTSYSTLNLV